MSRILFSNMTPAGCGRKRTGLSAIVVFLAVLLPTQALADNTQALLRSLIIPGSGQAHKGQYTKAAVFAGATVLSGAGLFLSWIHYNQAADRYEGAKKTYLGYGDQLAGGTVVNITDINATYDQMTSAWNDADGRHKWRTFFAVTLAATYALNIIDVIITDPAPVDPKLPPMEQSRFYMETDPDNVRLGARFNF